MRLYIGVLHINVPGSDSDAKKDSGLKDIPTTQSQSSNEVDRNREYKIRRAALGDNPTQEEMDAIVAYGLQQHRLNLSHLCK